MGAITLFLAPRGVNYLNFVTNRQKRWHLSCTDWFTGTKFYRTKSVLRVYRILLALREIDCTLRLKFWNKNARKRFHWKTGKLPLVKVTKRSSKMKCYVKLALKQTHINFQYTDGKKLNKQHKHSYRQHGLEDLIKFKQESAKPRSAVRVTAWKVVTKLFVPRMRDFWYGYASTNVFLFTANLLSKYLSANQHWRHERHKMSTGPQGLRLKGGLDWSMTSTRIVTAYAVKYSKLQIHNFFPHVKQTQTIASQVIKDFFNPQYFPKKSNHVQRNTKF